MRKLTKWLFKTPTGSILILGILTITILAGIWKVQEVATGYAFMALDAKEVTQAKAQLMDFKDENEALKQKLEASAKIQTPESVRKLSEFYIKKYFGDKAAIAEKIFTCESGLNPQTVHVNKPGLGSDFGIAQINDRFHKARFEKMYNVPFEIGAHDYDLNIKYAKYLYDHSGNFSPWVCSRVVSLASK